MFLKAQSVWAKDEFQTKNSHLILLAKPDTLMGAKISIAVGYFYKLFVNGEFVGFGPSRTAKGYARVDEYDLTPFNQAENTVKIEVAGYFCKSLSTCQVNNFITAEITVNGVVTCATGVENSFKAYKNIAKIAAVERYSFQRHFGEVIDYDTTVIDEANEVELTVSFYPEYLPRRVPYAYYGERDVDTIDKYGTFSFDETLPCKNNRYSEVFGEYWGKYCESDIKYFPYRWMQKQALVNQGRDKKLPVSLKKGEYAVFDFKNIEVGFIKWAFKAQEKSDIVIAFSEMVINNDFEFQNANLQNVIELLTPENGYITDESFEPYSFRYVVVCVKEGEISLEGFGVKTYERDKLGVRANDIKDKELSDIYDAAVRTYVHNAVDLYTDCPSRERAGWLCDSYFTAKAEYFLYGDNLVEDAFLENFVLYSKDALLPKGMLPMCYPGDVPKDGKFIPQWCMWYVLEVYEYLTARNPKFDKDFFKTSIYGVVDFILKFQNEDGLIEKLPSWNFIEWSSANWWTHDVNYPTQFLFSQVLESAGKLYNDERLIKTADHIRTTTIEKAFDGEFFVDHAVRDGNGVLKNLTDTSEASQYYALLFGKIDIEDEKYVKLKNRVFGSFDGVEKERNFVPVNAFIGFYLRQLYLLSVDKKDVLKRDIKSFFGGMVEKTGTLWEYKPLPDGGTNGSLDHGFASLAAISAYRLDKN